MPARTRPVGPDRGGLRGDARRGLWACPHALKARKRAERASSHVMKVMPAMSSRKSGLGWWGVARGQHELRLSTATAG